MWMSPAGLIPGFIGLGYLISHRLGVARRERERGKRPRTHGAPHAGRDPFGEEGS